MGLLGGVVNVALLIALVGGFFWAPSVLGELRRGQLALRNEIDRIARAVGLPPRPDQAVITCDRCGADYSASLTGCDQCGCAKPKDAVAHDPA